MRRPNWTKFTLETLPSQIERALRVIQHSLPLNLLVSQQLTLEPPQASTRILGRLDHYILRRLLRYPRLLSVGAPMMETVFILSNLLAHLSGLWRITCILPAMIKAHQIWDRNIQSKPSYEQPIYQISASIKVTFYRPQFHIGTLTRRGPSHPLAPFIM